MAELLESKKKLEKEIAELKFKTKLSQVDAVLTSFSEVGEMRVYKSRINADNMDELKSFGDEIRNKMKSGIAVLFAVIEDKAGIVCVISDDIIKEKKLSAGKIVGELAKMLGGGGGGRPHLATAGGKDISQIPHALSSVEEVIAKFL